MRIAVAEQRELFRSMLSRGASPYVVLALSGAYVAYRVIEERRRMIRANGTKPAAIIFGPAAKFAASIAARLKTEWEVVVASVSSTRPHILLNLPH